MEKREISKELQERITETVNDSADSIENRIERVISLQQDFDNLEKTERLEAEAACYEALIEMLQAEHAELSNALELLELYALLAEAYDELEEYRSIKKIAIKVRDIIRINAAPWEALEQTVPRIIDAVNDTVYNHASYDLTLMFLRQAYKEGHLDRKLKGRARRLLKLRILLEDADGFDSFFSTELQEAIAKLFTSEELMKIIMEPQIGHLKRDPVEYTFRWEDIYYRMEQKLKDRFANAPRHMGFCFLYWNAKRDLLKEEYGIDWKSPSQMNPRVMFD